jgi:hypothetical protein
MRTSVAFVGVAALATLPVMWAGPVGAAAPSGPLCFGQPATIVGTPGDDTLVGQSGVSDVIWAVGATTSSWVVTSSGMTRSPVPLLTCCVAGRVPTV